MEMLRDWNGDSLAPIQDILTLFGIEASRLHLVKYEVLSPDSFIWVLNTDKDRFCLYAEDYVGSIDDVVEAMKLHGTLTGETDNYKLQLIKNHEEFTASSPVASADTYTPPTDTKEFMKYAASSGHDFVFLGKSTIS